MIAAHARTKLSLAIAAALAIAVAAPGRAWADEVPSRQAHEAHGGTGKGDGTGGGHGKGDGTGGGKGDGTGKGHGKAGGEGGGKGHAETAAAHGATGDAPSPHADADEAHEATTGTSAHGASAAHGEHSDEHGGATAHGEHGAAHGGHHGPEPINWTDVGDTKKPAYLALVINVGLLFGLYYTLGKKPAAAALKKRRDDLSKDIDEAQKILDEALARAKKYQKKLKSVEADAETAKKALVAAGEGDAERTLTEAKERAARMTRDSATLVDQERKQASFDLRRSTAEQAVARAEQVLTERVTDADHARLAEEFLRELAEAPAAKSEGGSL